MLQIRRQHSKAPGQRSMSSMGLWPTDGDESALIGFIDSKQVTRDFRGSAVVTLRQLS